MERIVVFSNMYPSPQHPTFGIFVKNQVELLKSADVAVDVLAIDNPGKGKATALKKYMSWFFRSFVYMMKNRKALSITHAHYAFPTGLLSLIGKKMMGIPYVVTVHGGDIDQMAAKGPFIAGITKTILQAAEAVIVVGEKLKTDVTGRFEVPGNRVHVISMGVNTAVFKPTVKEEARTTLSLPLEKKIILYVGNVIRAKGLLELVEAYTLVKTANPDSELYIVGSQKDSSFVKELQAVIQEKNVEGVHFQAPVGQAELAQWMSAASVLTLPSHQEGFGLVALEAMAAGTKVVGTDVGGLSYLLNQGAGILVEPKDADSLAEGLKEALNPSSTQIDEKVMQDMVSAHSFDTVLKKLLAIYQAAENKQVGNR
ncbi:glycosyltransferase [Sporosarcina sp. FSL K6-1522]|uniref:glycosyltransferase n=1 Tax=Sporosarcina sp. FSL K6-1522 TaxID=2921554 RepID=UPI00315AAA51